MDIDEHFKNGGSTSTSTNIGADVGVGVENQLVGESVPTFLGEQGMNVQMVETEKKDDVFEEQRKEEILGSANNMCHKPLLYVTKEPKLDSEKPDDSEILETLEYETGVSEMQNTYNVLEEGNENANEDENANVNANEIANENANENDSSDESYLEGSSSESELCANFLTDTNYTNKETIAFLTALSETSESFWIKRRNKKSPDVNIHKIMHLVAKDTAKMKQICVLKENNKCLCYYPLLTPYHHIKKLVDILIEENYEYENTWTVYWDAKFVARLLYEGLIPVANKSEVKKVVNNRIVKCEEPLLIPKIHYIRSCMHPSEIHISRKVRKLCKHFYITVDKDFDGVVKGIIEKHGENWLYPFIQKEFKKLFNKEEKYKNVEMHSVEVWYGDELVAGEIGNSVGAVYTSLTGFQRKNNAGTIQLCALAKLLEHQKFQLWDLGMLLPYKKDIGSKEVPMREFFIKHRKYKHQEAEFKVPFREKLNCSVLIKGAKPEDFD